MPAFICTACGTQYPPSDAPPAQCPVCEDERQYIPPVNRVGKIILACNRKCPN